MINGVGKRLFANLDMVSVSNKKKNKTLPKKIIVYVNSLLFLKRLNFVLQIKNVKYEATGLIEEAWNLIKNSNYKQADEILDRLLLYTDSSYRTFFGKFITSLFQDKDAYIYLKRTIETKCDAYNDDYYRLYLTLYNELIDISDDYIPLLELLSPKKKIVAFNKNSFNGHFLSFLNYLDEKNYQSAKKELNICLSMKNDIYLVIVNILLDKLIEHQKYVKKMYIEQEKRLEKDRAFKFAEAIKNNNLVEAKKILETIISYRSQENKNNYIYYLFLEMLETIELVDTNLVFEIMPIEYNYSPTKDNFTNFQEAIAAGDFKYALEFGNKCRNKVLDNHLPVIKVKLYVILLEILFKKLAEREKNIDNLYQILISNIEKGNYRHALNLYNMNTKVLKDYNNKLVNYLFNLLMNKSAELVIKEQESIEEAGKIIESKVQNVDLVKMEHVDSKDDEVEPTILKDNIETSTEIKDDAAKAKPVKIIKPINNEVTIFLRHKEPNNVFFQKYQICLINKKYAEAKGWLDYFAELLNSNNIKKRLDYYYYQINLGMLENQQSEEIIMKRKKTYFFAYNYILEGKYEEALSYLTYYVETDSINDVRGHLLLGRLYTLMKNYKKAIECYIKANSIAPNPDSYYFLGEIYYKEHRYADAIFCYLTFNEFYPKENPTVYLNLAECYKHLDKTDKVVKYLRLAEEINVEQKRGLYLKDRILKAEIIDKKKREHFLLNKESSPK